MATFNMRMSIQYLNGAGTPGFENDGEPVIGPTAGDYSADIPNSVGIKHGTVVQLGVIVGNRLFYNPSPFTLIREVDPNIFPATSNGFNQGFN